MLSLLLHHNFKQQTLGNKAGRTPLTKAINPAPQGNNYLLAIAIDDYAHCAKLRNCVSGVQEVVKVLTDKYGFEKTITLFNQDATYDNISDTLNHLKGKIQKDVDNLVLYFSGHGETEGSEEAQIGYLIPVEARQGKDQGYIPHLHLHLRSKLHYRSPPSGARGIEALEPAAHHASDFVEFLCKIVIHKGGVEAQVVA